MRLCVAAVAVLLAACSASSPQAAPGPTNADVIIVPDEMAVSMALLEQRSRAQAIRPDQWDSLFATEGYRKLAEREHAMGRVFTDSAFREFLLSDTLLARLPSLRPAAASWRSIDVTAAVRKAQVYLPTGTPIRARLYPLVKPRTNSFVHQGAEGPMGIFMYLDPVAPKAELETTLAHELHHIGYSAACDDAGATASTASPAARMLHTRMGAFGEGLAMLAAAGSPDVNPNVQSRAERLATWNKNIADVAGDLAKIDSLVRIVADGRITSPDTVLARAFTFYGDQGPWYTVGWWMASTVERARGRAHLISVMCSPSALMEAYDSVARQRDPGGAALPRWSEATLQFMRVR